MEEYWGRAMVWLKEIGLVSVLDIVFMSLLIYAILVWFKKTRAGFVLTGIFIVAGVYLVTRQFSLVMTASVFEEFFGVILIILVVIFQEELRHFFEQVAVFSLNRRRVRRKIPILSREEVGVLVRTVFDLVRERVGALIVLRGKEMIVRHLEGEINLNGELSEPLLKSLFDPNSIGHDGAVVIEGSRVSKFGCFLPLSKNLRSIRDRGTRHAAGLGISEVSDSLCIIVSEEQGTVSITRHGGIVEVRDPERLNQILENFYEEQRPRAEQRTWMNFIMSNWREKIYALFLTVALWYVLVYGSGLTYRDLAVPITYVQPPKPWIVKEIVPEEVQVSLRGPRRAFFFNAHEKVKLPVNLRLEEGTQRVRIFSDNLVIPKGLVLEGMDVRTVRVVLEKQKPEIKKQPVEATNLIIETTEETP